MSKVYCWYCSCIAGAGVSEYDELEMKCGDQTTLCHILFMRKKSVADTVECRSCATGKRYLKQVQPKRSEFVIYTSLSKRK